MRDVLSATIEALRPHIEDAKWVPPENLHVTVSFLGWVDDERVDEIARALQASAAACARVPTRLAGLGVFPGTSGARVIWAGLADEAGRIAAVAMRLHQGLAQIGFDPETRPWQAHATIARLRRPRAVSLGVEVEPVGFDIDQVVLFQSRLQRPSPVYLPVAIVPLA